MNIITSPTPAAAYLSFLKENMEDHLSFGEERFTGFFLGKWFHITHHAGYNWNERYTNQKNAAVGYVKRTESGCEVRFLTFKGLLCPAQFLTFIPFSYLLMVLYLLSHGVMAPSVWTFSLIGPGVTAISAAIGTLFESMTPPQYGRQANPAGHAAGSGGSLLLHKQQQSNSFLMEEIHDLLSN